MVNIMAESWMLPVLIAVIAAVVLIIGVTICWCCCCRNRSQKQAGYALTSDVESQGWVDYRDSYPGADYHTQYDTSPLDLHGYTVPQALSALKQRLVNAFQGNRNQQHVDVITGRGNHSVGGIPVIKNATQNYLNNKKYRYKWKNPGMVRIFAR